MLNFFQWALTQNSDRPWVILGKGPSFQKRDSYDLKPYRLLSLNHVVREIEVEVAHLIDIEVVESCGQALLDNARVVVMPWFPHVRNRVGEMPLTHWVEKMPVLASLQQSGRLLWYDLSTSRTRVGEDPMVCAHWFSAEAAIHMLALAGFRTIRSLGVDGGSDYAHTFEDLSGTTRLSNGHASYDLQFEKIANVVFKNGVDFAPLGAQTPIRVFVGSQREQMLAVKVLEYSIRRRSSMPVDVVPLHTCSIEFPKPRDPRNHPRTPFSFQRFAIPLLCEFKGQAIYLDSDMLVFSDIRKLWMHPMGGADIQATPSSSTSRRPQFSVMLMNCSQLDWKPQQLIERLDSGEMNYERMVLDMEVASSVRADIDPIWNSLEHFQKGRTALLHYTDMNRQPWLHRYNRNGHLWVGELIEAVESGFIAEDLVREHVARKWVRPSLLMQVSERRARLGTKHLAALCMDRGFVPPHRRVAEKAS